ncbi:MAG: DUF1499 domain-containing protein [Nitrospirae bacterium]|nr:DUF1499 domain-containing protein [Nitrospirota bacterium]
MPHALHSSWLLLLPAVLLVGCQGTRPANLGARDGRLLPCPSSLNCVSSQATDEDHRVAPLVYAGSVDDAMNRLKAIIRSLPRTAVITDTGAYLHVEFTTALFRFVDDVEFLADDSAKSIHVRSASRLGTSDLGVNGQRIEKIRKRWQEPSPPP